MTTTRFLAIGLGAGLLLGSSAALAQSKDDDRQASPTDAVTKPLGDSAGQAGSTGDRSTPSGSSSPLGASGSNPAQQNLSFGVLDVNTDGKLSKDEVKGNATLTTDFSKLDTDRSGSLSNGEFAAFEGSAKSGQSSSGESSKAGKAERKTQRAGDKAERKAEKAGDKAEEETKETMD